MRNLQTALGLTLIHQKHQKLYIAIFVGILENLKDIANRSDRIGIALN